MHYQQRSIADLANRAKEAVVRVEAVEEVEPEGERNSTSFMV